MGVSDTLKYARKQAGNILLCNDLAYMHKKYCGMRIAINKI